MKKKIVEQLLRQAYRAGQDSISCMKVKNEGIAKPSHSLWCDDEPCKHKLEEETSTAEDEAVEKLMRK